MLLCVLILGVGGFFVAISISQPALPALAPPPATPGSALAPTLVTPPTIATRLTPTTGHVGTTLSVSGSGFIAGAMVTIKYDNTEVTTATVGANGAFSATFKAPVSKAGDHTILASDGTNTEQLTFTMESTAPSTPLPLLPQIGVKAEALTHFDWGDVTDDSLPVTCTLQIATDTNFTTIVVEKKGLTDSEYTIALPSTGREAPYYWRVKAVDGASNESGWTGARSFFTEIKYSLSTSVNPPGSGTVSPGGGTHDAGTSVTLTATAASDYQFSNWSGDVSGTSPTITITMDSNKSVIANFIKLYQRIEYTMPAGSIAGSEVLYSKALKVGDKVDGFVQLTGQYYGIDWSYEWTFQIIGPGGEPIKPPWKGHWVNNNYHEFSFTASYAGTYKIRAYHASSYPKNLTIEIWPPGWGYSGS